MVSLRKKLNSSAGEDFARLKKSSRNVIPGDDNDNVIFAIAPDQAETLFGYGGNDRLHGNATKQPSGSDDLLYGGLGNDQLFGGQGMDLSGAGGRSRLYGDEGDDYLYAQHEAYGGAGVDWLETATDPALGTPVKAYGGDDNDTIRILGGNGIGYGGAGDDSVRVQVNPGFAMKSFELYGDDGHDRLSFTNYANPLGVAAGATFRASGGEGDDVITIGYVDVQIYGGAGIDRILADGNSQIWGGVGDDRIFDDFFEIINSLQGDRTVWGEEGNDHVWLAYGRGDDLIFGGDGDDYLAGGRGADYLEGGAGNDTLVAYAGDEDRMFGGQGADLFVVSDLMPYGRGALIDDFSVAEGDKMSFAELGGVTGDLIAGGYLQVTDGDLRGYAAVMVDRDGTGGAHGFVTVAQVKVEDVDAFANSAFWTLT